MSVLTAINNKTGQREEVSQRGLSREEIARYLRQEQHHHRLTPGGLFATHSNPIISKEEIA